MNVYDWKILIFLKRYYYFMQNNRNVSSNLFIYNKYFIENSNQNHFGDNRMMF